jgi:spore germination protein KA
MNQLRRRFLDDTLQFHALTIGRLQHTQVVVTYLEGVTNPGLIQTAIDRISQLSIDGYANSTLISGLIRDHPRSIFPTIRATERVDVAVWRLNEGKIVVHVDGDPFVLIAPAPLSDFYRTAMDYATPWYDATFSRLIRFAGWALGIYLPALYIAFTEVNPSLVPSALIIIILGDHAGLPFPPIVEVILMIFVVEILREAALRLPKALSTTIGTVGAIVVGTAIVRAGLVSPQIIVLMTLTALSFFSAPVYELTGTWRIMGFLMLIAAFLLGLLGIVIASVVMIAELTTMSSFGVPYMTPWTPFRWKDWRDAAVRVPWPGYNMRPAANRSLQPNMRGPRQPHTAAHLYHQQRESSDHSAR